jgi:hypothetical protein
VAVYAYVVSNGEPPPEKEKGFYCFVRQGEKVRHDNRARKLAPDDIDIAISACEKHRFTDTGDVCVKSRNFLRL